MKFHLHRETWKLQQPFRIAGKVWEQCDIAVVEVEDGGAVGRGEGKGVYYINDTLDRVCGQLEAVAADVERGVARADLPKLLPPGGARNALDCALWDLEAKRSGKSIWTLTGASAKPVTTPYTIGIQPTTEAMASAATAAKCGILKIKLDATAPLERMRAIRKVRPDARLVVDANQGWTFDLLKDIAPGLAELGVLMIEQPLPRGADDALEGYRSPLPLCADESCQHQGDLETVARRYQMVNIKLDKIGGLTDALAMIEACRARNMRTMVGCMIGTSLAMAPAFVVAQFCELADIDGPLMLSCDRPFGLTYNNGMVSPPSAALWG